MMRDTDINFGGQSLKHLITKKKKKKKKNGLN